MKKCLSAIWIVFMGALVLQAADLKIGYVDYEKVFSAYYKTDAVNADLKKRTDDWQKKLDTNKTEIAGLKEAYDKKEPTLSDDLKKTERKKIMDKLQEYQDMGQDLTGKLKEMQFNEYEKLKKEIDIVIKDLGAKKGYTAILDRNAVYFGGEDLTDEVISIINKEAPKTAPKSPK
ncbi:MAG: OmpH family outer membrane protein [Candidatus Wallbacteria bacterium]|nr:OmpH family outer membrane protein [Candidatus Wallbacteria bacterium]